MLNLLALTITAHLIVIYNGRVLQTVSYLPLTTKCERRRTLQIFLKLSASFISRLDRAVAWTHYRHEECDSLIVSTGVNCLQHEGHTHQLKAMSTASFNMFTV